MENVKQTGLLIKFDPRDYRVGASPVMPVIVNESADWVEWIPSEEQQFKSFAFDTMSCATFSALNVVENTVNFLIAKGKLTGPELKWLTENGYIENGKLNCSDRFTAIMSGTTEQGNYMQNVWDSIRKQGALPEKDFPFGGNSWSEYHNKSLITDTMKTKALKFLDIFESAYEWTSITPSELTIALKQCPLQIAINNGSHAVELINLTYRFDTYPPYLILQDTPITYALKGMVRIKTMVPRTLKIGMKGPDVIQMQNDLIYLGYSVGVADGNFGNKTFLALKSFQLANALVPDGVAGPKTFAKIAELKKK